MFDTLIIQPVFNLLFLIYGLLPGHDFGIAILIFTVVVRLALFPLVRKQIRQTKAIRELQPELKEIRKKAKGDKQQEAMMTMQLYRDRKVSAFGPLGTLLIQMPIIIGLFQAMRWISNEPTRLIRSLYSPVAELGFIKGITGQFTDRFSELSDTSSLSNESLDALNSALATLIDNQEIVFDQTLLGIVDLSRQGLDGDGIYLPLVIVALLAGIFQYYQSKQTMVDQGDSKSVREIIKEAGDSQPDQAELNAAMMRNMRFVFPVITIFFSVSFPGSLALYWAASSFFAVLQQRYLLNNESALMKGADEKPVVKTTVRTKSESRKKVANQAKSGSQKSSTKKSSNAKKKGSKK